MALSEADRARISADQRAANLRAISDPDMAAVSRERISRMAAEDRRLAAALPSSVPPTPPAEAYEEPDVSRETNETPQEPEPVYVNWFGLMGQVPPERHWFVDGWLTTGPSLLAGKGGVGKSLLAQTLATALVLGRDYVQAIEEDHRVLLWACEDDQNELWRRQLAICDHFGVNFGPLGHLMVEPRLGLENTLCSTVYGAATLTPLVQRLREQVNDLQTDVLFLDNVGQCFGANENSRHDVTLFVNALAGLVTDRPFSVIILAHPARSAGSEYAGSAAWENAVRTRWYMGHSLPDQPEPREGGETDPALRFLCKRKSNYSTSDYVRMFYEGGVFKIQPPEADHDGTTLGEREACQQAVLFAVRKAADVGSRVIKARNSPSALLTWMRNLNIGQEFSDKAIMRAVDQLFADGRITEKTVGRYGNRRGATGLVIADQSAPFSGGSGGD